MFSHGEPKLTCDRFEGLHSRSLSLRDFLSHSHLNIGISPGSTAILPPKAIVAPIGDSNSSSYVDSDDEGRDSDVSEDFGDDDPFADSEDDIDNESLVGSDNVIIASSPDILKPSQCVLPSPNSQNTGNYPLIHNTPDSDDGTKDGSSACLNTDDSDA